MADIISQPLSPERRAKTDRKEWSLVLGVLASVLGLTYLAASLHARYSVNPNLVGFSQSAWFPLKLFVIAISPAAAGFIFLWSERHLRSKATQKLLQVLAILGLGLTLAAWVAFVPR